MQFKGLERGTISVQLKKYWEKKNYLEDTHASQGIISFTIKSHYFANRDDNLTQPEFQTFSYQVKNNGHYNLNKQFLLLQWLFQQDSSSLRAWFELWKRLCQYHHSTRVIDGLFGDGNSSALIMKWLIMLSLLIPECLFFSHLAFWNPHSWSCWTNKSMKLYPHLACIYKSQPEIIPFISVGIATSAILILKAPPIPENEGLCIIFYNNIWRKWKTHPTLFNFAIFLWSFWILKHTTHIRSILFTSGSSNFVWFCYFSFKTFGFSSTQHKFLAYY